MSDRQAIAVPSHASSTLARWRRLPADERRQTLRAALALPLVGLSLRLIGYKRTRRLLEQRVMPFGLAADRDSADINVVARSVARAANHLPMYWPTCLPQSLVVWHNLRREGLPADLRIGVSKSGDTFLAHAWVEFDGQVVNDTPDVAQRFAPVELPPDVPHLRW